MWLIVGLGNPGAEYALTRHNAGFMAVDVLASAARVTIDELQCYSLIGKGRFAGEPVVLAKPLTFMNRSGEAVSCLLKLLKLGPSNLLVIHDDMDLPCGTLRLKPAGGAGGHKGMESIIQAIGTSEFGRLRIGIGKPARGKEIDYVLSPFSEEEYALVSEQLSRVPEIVGSLLARGYNYTMSTYNKKADAAIDSTR
jgi:PTH1 family peptidyl-tRNA hydrolase